NLLPIDCDAAGWIEVDVVGTLVHKRRRWIVAQNTVRTCAGETRNELFGFIDLKNERWRLENVRRQMLCIGVKHHQLSKRVVFELGAEIQARGTRQIVKAIAVLQRFQLVLEHKIEGRSEQSAKRHLFFGEASHPEVDQVDTRGGDAVC